MQVLINILIYAGSALMVYNIIKYASFVKSSIQLEHQNGRKSIIITPLVLLIFFLIGYLVVGITGVADLMVSAILFFGSVFVFLLLSLMYSIIGHVRQTDVVLAQRYYEMKSQLNALTKDASAAMLVNLTKDEIEDRAGEYLNDADYQSDTYSEVFELRTQNIVDPARSGMENSVFRREALLRMYSEGQTGVSEVMLTKKPDGSVSFVRCEATVSLMPVSSDIIAMITEKPYNESMVRSALLEKIMMGEYDHVAYIIDGQYNVLMSNSGRKSGLVLPEDPGDDYETVYYNYFLPAMVKGKEKSSAPNPLRLSVIEKALDGQDFYTVNAEFVIDGETRYKRILFYCMERSARFYLMLISDSTEIHDEESKRGMRLAEALEEKARADKARTAFIGRVTRDLQKPLDAMLGSIDRLGSEGSPNDRDAQIKNIAIACRISKALMEDMQTMNLIEKGELVFDEKPTDLQELVSSVTVRVKDIFEQKGCGVITDLERVRDIRAICDPYRLSSVLIRLLANSCAFMQRGDNALLTVTQETDRAEKTGYYTFTVRNRGIRIPPDVISHIFEADAWEENEIAIKLPGVGVGMVISKAIIEKMGGTVTVGSTESGDTSFSVKVPLTPAVSEKESVPDGAGGKPLRILLADDNEINRELGELMLSAEGWTVELACDGAEAVKKVSAAAPGTYDLILMDVQMPVMNGYDAARAIRALPDKKLASIPVIAVTANAFEEDIQNAKEAGMDGYVTKPISVPAIRRAAEEALSGNNNRSQGSEL